MKILLADQLMINATNINILFSLAAEDKGGTMYRMNCEAITIQLPARY